MNTHQQRTDARHACPSVILILIISLSSRHPSSRTFIHCITRFHVFVPWTDWGAYLCGWVRPPLLWSSSYFLYSVYHDSCSFSWCVLINSCPYEYLIWSCCIPPMYVYLSVSIYLLCVLVYTPIDLFFSSLVFSSCTYFFLVVLVSAVYLHIEEEEIKFVV